MGPVVGASAVQARSADDDLVEVVEAWIADDPDPARGAELRALLDAGERDELSRRFRDSLHFGTAGWRGQVRAGPSGMNPATVRRASAGLAAYLASSVPHALGARVVVGCDARHGSERFAHQTARVFSGAGFRALRLPGQRPTPLLAFAVRHLTCAAGVMITASHNPAQDNGYKVYLGNGAQIVPPADEAISTAIGRVGPLDRVRLGGPGEPVGADIVGDYLAAIIAALPPSASHVINTVYTPFHGVGRDVLLAGFDRAGFPAPHVVAIQGDPDPKFPTLPKPNPEEAGAPDLAIADARVVGADLVLANDPDADRLAVAIPDGARPGGWRTITATTIVSSGLLCRLADTAGVGYAETLTGLKWIMHDSAARSGLRFLFGCEEAIGYAVNDIVRDKARRGGRRCRFRQVLDRVPSGRGRHGRSHRDHVRGGWRTARGQSGRRHP
jgi:phosphomannomutase